MSLAVVILTYNEERHIARAMKSVTGIANEIFVIDSFSTDDTRELAQTLGATVLQVEFVSFAHKFQWALENAPITADWVLRIDADEVVEPDLADEIRARLPSLGSDIAGVNLKRKYVFLDRWIKHGGRYPLIDLRIWRRGQGRMEARWLDEHIIVWGGGTVTFAGNFTDHNLNDLTTFVTKHNGYATREAVEVLNQRHGLFRRDNALSEGAGSRQAVVKRFFKERIYNRLPFWAGPLGYFLYRYFFRLGFLDGRAGLIYHFLQGFWYRFLVNAKVLEFEMALAGISDPAEKKAELARLTGLEL